MTTTVAFHDPTPAVVVVPRVCDGDDDRGKISADDDRNEEECDPRNPGTGVHPSATDDQIPAFLLSNRVADVCAQHDLPVEPMADGLRLGILDTEGRVSPFRRYLWVVTPHDDTGDYRKYAYPPAIQDTLEGAWPWVPGKDVDISRDHCVRAHVTALSGDVIGFQWLKSDRRRGHDHHPVQRINMDIPQDPSLAKQFFGVI